VFLCVRPEQHIGAVEHQHAGRSYTIQDFVGNCVIDPGGITPPSADKEQ
jgi:hypothetical protein